jgi:hypothetical protein
LVLKVQRLSYHCVTKSHTRTSNLYQQIDAISEDAASNKLKMNNPNGAFMPASYHNNIACQAFFLIFFIIIMRHRILLIKSDHRLCDMFLKVNRLSLYQFEKCIDHNIDLLVAAYPEAEVQRREEPSAFFAHKDSHSGIADDVYFFALLNPHFSTRHDGAFDQ